MVKNFYTIPIKLSDGTIRLELLNADEIPTLRQFRYWYSKKYDSKDKLMLRKGEAQYNLKHRAILGKSDMDIHGPGSQYQIDATVGDVYLMSRYFGTDRDGNNLLYEGINAEARVVSVIRAGIFVDLFGVETYIALRELSYQRGADAAAQ